MVPLLFSLQVSVHGFQEDFQMLINVTTEQFSILPQTVSVELRSGENGAVSDPPPINHISCQTLLHLFLICDTFPASRCDCSNFSETCCCRQSQNELTSFTDRCVQFFSAVFILGCLFSRYHAGVRLISLEMNPGERHPAREERRHRAATLTLFSFFIICSSVVRCSKLLSFDFNNRRARL